MTEQEVNGWIATEDGAKWLESQKSGLINKRDELLAEVKSLNERYTQATALSNAQAEKIASYENRIKGFLIESELNKKNNFFLESTKDLAMGDILSRCSNIDILQDSEGLGKVLDDWSKSDRGKTFLKALASGSGASSSYNIHASNDSFDGLSTVQIANKLRGIS